MYNLENNAEDLSKYKKEFSILEYLKENCAALTLITAVLAPIISVFLTLMLYSYYHGYYKYFSLSEVWLDLTGSVQLFYPLFMVFVSLLIMIFNLAPILFVKYKGRSGLIFDIVSGILALGIWIVIFILTYECITFIVAVQILTCWLVTYGLGCIDGIAIYIKEKKKYRSLKSIKSKNLNQFTTVNGIVFAILIVAEIFLCYLTGLNIAKSKKEFKVLDYKGKKMAVLLETDDSFVISEIKEVNGEKSIKICTNEQVIIDNDNIVYKFIKFDEVVIK